MKLTASDQRRVIQCGCGRSMPWRDERAAIVAGWGRGRSAEGEVLADVWRCPDCRPRSAPSPDAERSTPPIQVPRASLEVVLRHLAHPKSGDAIEGALKLQREIARLFASEDPIAIAWAKAHVEAIGGLVEQHRKPRGRARHLWGALLGEHASRPPRRGVRCPT